VKRFLPFLLAVLALSCARIAAADDTTPTPSTIAEGVTIATVDVSGMTPDDATAAVQQAFGQSIELSVAGTRVLVTPDLLGGRADIQKAVLRATTAVAGAAIALPVTVDRSVTARFIASLAKRFDRQASSSQLLLRHGRPFLTKDRAGRTLDQRRTVGAIVTELRSNTRDPLTVGFRHPKPAVTRRTYGPVIVIHRGENRLFLYDGMRFERMFAVATGQSQYPTPLGRFKIVVKWRNPWWYPPASPWAQGAKPIPPGPGNPLGTRWMGLSAPGVGIHGTPSDGSIGYSVSHGCIRMHIPEAEWLFNRVDIGTTVFITPH
jgi:lipoprotein-anchoring transpeptidase ErfK/SrfK